VAIAIVTDGAADLPAELVAKHRIGVVPLEVRLAGHDALRDDALSPEAFWRLSASSGALAETAAPSPGAFRDAFVAAAEAGYDGVVCVTLSSRLSATYEAAVAGAREARATLAVEVVDSRSVTMGEGLLVLEAAERAEAGEPLGAVAHAVRAALEDVAVVGTLDTLENLRRGGRIGTAQALVGSLLSIKPVIEVRDGVVEAESRQRTRARSLRYLADKVAGLGPLKRLAVVHAAADDLDAMLALLEPLHPSTETIVSWIGPVVGAHTGPGTIGVCAQRA